MTNYEAVINKYGEAIQGIDHVVTKKEQAAKDAYKERNRKQYELAQLINTYYSTFFFYKYDELLDYIEGDTATAFRFLYLCSFADKRGYIMVNDQKYCTRQKDFVEIFDKTDSTVHGYVEELYKDNLIFNTDDGKYQVNMDFYSTKLDDDIFRQNSIRAFRRAIKSLYHNSSPREHSKIGEILKIVPFVNIYNNIICKNPKCSNSDEIEPMTIQEVLSILRPDSDYGRKIFKELEMLTVNDEFVIGIFESAGEKHCIMNPRIFYGGNDPQNLQSLIDQFDVSKCQFLNNKRRAKLKRKEKLL